MNCGDIWSPELELERLIPPDTHMMPTQRWVFNTDFIIFGTHDEGLFHNALNALDGGSAKGGSFR